MLVFFGKFSVNFEIPDYWGIGKSVSRGFGTVKRIRNSGIQGFRDSGISNFGIINMITRLEILSDGGF